MPRKIGRFISKKGLTGGRERGILSETALSEKDEVLMDISGYDHIRQTYASVKGICADKRYLSDEEYKKIRDYLKRHEFAYIASTAPLYDIFAKAYSDEYCRAGYTDGRYEWSAEEIFYFEKYHLILNDEFIRYVLDK